MNAVIISIIELILKVHFVMINYTLIGNQIGNIFRCISKVYFCDVSDLSHLWKEKCNKLQ